MDADVVNKANLLGLPIKEVKIHNDSDKNCYFITVEKDKTALVIPDNITKLNAIAKSNAEYSDYIDDVSGDLIVIGGKSLVDCTAMFNCCNAKSIDLSQFDSHNAVYMKSMFAGAKAKSINFNNFDTSRCKTMENMFFRCNMSNLDLSTFNTKNVESMAGMFCDASINNLNLSNFDVSNVKNMEKMFFGFHTDELNLESFVTPKLENVRFMFSYCEARKINMKNMYLDTKETIYTYTMFNRCCSEIETNDKLISKLISKINRFKN